MIKLSTNILGTFALKDGKIIRKILFPRNPEEIADKLRQIEGSVCDEEEQIIEYLVKTGNNSVYVNNPKRFWGKGFDIEFIEDKKSVDPLAIASELGISRKEFSEIISKANFELTRKKLGEVDRDQIIIQAIDSIDDIEEASNKLIERLREWYSLHFPELDHVVKKHEVYANFVSSNYDRIDAKFLEEIKNIESNTFGVKFSNPDIEALKSLSDQILNLYSLKERMESYIEKSMIEIAPNISELAGPILSARLISLANSLERLSRMPASTIQVLGAEDAFFQFLKTRKRPPKHGVIFQLPEIMSAPKNLRGKIARTFAAKCAIAAKADYFKGEFIGEKLRKDFLKRVESLKKSR